MVGNAQSDFHGLVAPPLGRPKLNQASGTLSLSLVRQPRWFHFASCVCVVSGCISSRRVFTLFVAFLSLSIGFRAAELLSAERFFRAPLIPQIQSEIINEPRSCEISLCSAKSVTNAGVKLAIR